MRTSNLNVTLRIPIPIDEPDANGVIYTEEAVKEAYKNIKDLPIIQYNDGGITETVGVVTDGYYNNGIVTVNGHIWYGGSECKNVNLHKENGITVVDSFEITGFGITK